MEEKLTKKERRELARERKRKEKDKEIMVRKMRKFLVWIFAAGLILFVGFKSWAFVKSPSPEVAGIQIEIKKDDWVKGGNPQAQVTLVEYGDYQCPGCATYNPLVVRLSEEFPEDLKVVYRHFPIQGHKNAVPAAQAAEAAGMQGKFWEMNDLLYERQKDWENDGNVKEKFVAYAKEIGLDEVKFSADYDSGEVKNAINSDAESGRLIGISYTPTFILDGTRIQPRSYEEFKSLVEAQIKGYTVQ
jgi:protein-disulfide isomerase